MTATENIKSKMAMCAILGILEGISSTWHPQIAQAVYASCLTWQKQNGLEQRSIYLLLRQRDASQYNWWPLYEELHKFISQQA